jgi:AraC-type DNA-binding domain-containing proteins
MKYFVKNMVCPRCIMAVRGIFQELDYQPAEVSLGEVETLEPVSPEKLPVLREKLTSYGFELIDDSKSQLIERIKTLIIELIHYRKDDLKMNYSDLIESKLGKDYHYLSNLFSEVTGTTIEKFIISQKIERVKELLVYDEHTLSQIAYELGYSSVAHLSAQFKKVTGLTPGHFKQIGTNKRKPLDQV